LFRGGRTRIWIKAWQTPEPNLVPDLVKDMVPDLVAYLVSNFIPEMVSDLTSDLVLDLAPDLVLDLAPDLLPDLVLDAAAGQVSDGLGRHVEGPACRAGGRAGDVILSVVELRVFQAGLIPNRIHRPRISVQIP
jgi:hypothetical protein